LVSIQPVVSFRWHAAGENGKNAKIQTACCLLTLVAKCYRYIYFIILFFFPAKEGHPVKKGLWQ
jgi:hypothetical protein